MGRRRIVLGLCLLAFHGGLLAARGDDQMRYEAVLNVEPPHISTDRSIQYDYDIVYVRAPRAGDTIHKRFYTDIATPVTMEPGADLMLLHPDGSEELLVAGGEGAVTDPMVSFDGQWVFYTLIHTLQGAGPQQPPRQGADIYKMHVPTRKIERLTQQQFTPGRGAASASKGLRGPKRGKAQLGYGVLNFGPCPLPGGKVVFTSNRNALRPPRAYPPVVLQLFVMDDDGKNVEQIGYLNIAGALHPVVLADGRIIFSSLESQGTRSDILWGIWSIHPDGTNWQPVVSAFDPHGAPNAFHFQSQLSDGSLVVEEYYNQNNSGFGAYLKLPPSPPDGYPAFGPAWVRDPRHKPLRFGRFGNGKGRYYTMPFQPLGAESLTPFANNGEGPADPSVPGDPDSPRVGKFTHPSGAPDNHLLTIWSPGPVNHQYTFLPQLDGGIYLIKSGRPIDEPGEMRLIKNDPNYNEQWPRALVPYRRIYGVDEPQPAPGGPPLANDGRRSPHLPEGTPFGLVGTSSLYKRESYPGGVVPPGQVTAVSPQTRISAEHDPTGGYLGLDPFNTSENGASLNWFNQGADAGRYSNDQIHAIRILVMDPTTDRPRSGSPRGGRWFVNHAQERLRILGEIPVRKFEQGTEPIDPDNNPDTSFLAKIPADVAFTFQTLDTDGMLLNMAQTWHQLRPGEVRNNCGGCHAHSQPPTPFEQTAAAGPDYQLFDLTRRTPLVTTRSRDESGRQWDRDNQTGLRYEEGTKTVEFHRDVKPILERSCIACHTRRSEDPPGKLVLDDDDPIAAPNSPAVPGTYYRLAMDEQARFGYKPVIKNGTWRNHNASRYVRKFQSRRSLLIWKVFGRRTDGWSNDDFPTETTPGDPDTLAWKGRPVESSQRNRNRADLDFAGSIMPPPEAVAGQWQDAHGTTVKVAPLSDEDRLTLVRWIDLGCPLDLDYNPKRPQVRGNGWMCDDNRPTLVLTAPQAGANQDLSRIVVGMHDYYSGLDMKSFSVTASFPVDGMAAHEKLAPRFRPVSEGVWELKLSQPITSLPEASITVSVRDREGNVSRIERTFSVGAGHVAEGKGD